MLLNIPAVPIKAEEETLNTVVLIDWHYVDKLIYLEYLKELDTWTSAKAFSTNRLGENRTADSKGEAFVKDDKYEILSDDTWRHLKNTLPVLT